MFTDFFKVMSTKKRKRAVDTKGYVHIGDGFFFERLDSAYLNSPTATMVLLKFLEYCVPVGLVPEYAAIWGKIANDYIRYGYYLLNVTYDVDGRVSGVIYKNPKHFLIKDKDDNDNASTFINIKSNKIYPTFNRDPKVVKSQFPKDGGYLKYTGQVYMYNDTPLPYRISPMYSVIKYMEGEADAATYIEKASDNAMFGNNIFVIKASSDADAKELAVLGEVKEALSGAKGVSETAQNLLIEWKGDVDDVTKLLTKVSISNDVNVDLFNAADDKAEDKICVACYNFPKLLLFKDSGIFGDSGVAIQTATDLWAETCLRQADRMLKGFAEIGISIAEAVEAVEAVDTSVKEGQDELRSSAGGAQLVLQVQQSVARGTTSRESAIGIFEIFLGLSNSEAIKLLGDPEKIENGSTIDPNTGPA